MLVDSVKSVSVTEMPTFLISTSASPVDLKCQLSRGNIHAYAIRGGNEVYGIISAMDVLR